VLRYRTCRWTTCRCGMKMIRYTQRPISTVHCQVPCTLVDEICGTEGGGHSKRPRLESVVVRPKGEHEPAIQTAKLVDGRSTRAAKEGQRGLARPRISRLASRRQILGRPQRQRLLTGQTNSDKNQWLKGQCHEIFDLRFFRQSITPRPLINTLKYFRILFRIRRATRPLSLIPRYAAKRGIKIFYNVAPILKLYFVGYM
jgi:hypothetical protein